MPFTDFEIRIVKLDEENFAAIVVDAPKISFQLTQRGFPIPKAELDKVSRPDLSPVVEGKDPELRFPQSSTGQSVSKFGIDLFNQLLWGHDNPADLQRAWINFLEHEEKRLKLSLTEEASALPWEALYDSQSLNGFLARQDISIVRYVKISPSLEPLDVGQEPLRMLVVFADPDEDLREVPTGRQESHIAAEKEAISQALEPLVRKRDLEIDWIEPGQDSTTLQQIQRMVAQNRYHILHYFGHGSSDQQGLLYLEGGRRMVSYEVSWVDLKTALRNTLGSLRLVILNACELAQQDETITFHHTPFTNMATSCLNDGAAMVIAMQYPIRKATANQFTSIFYRYLHPYLFASAARIEEAVLTARRQIAISSSSVEWITPVVFTRIADDVIFQMPEERLKKYVAERQKQEKIGKLLKEVEGLYKKEQWMEAADKVKEILEKDPASEEGKVWREKVTQRQLLKEVEEMYEKEQWVEAADKVKEILEKDPTSEEGKAWHEKLGKKAIELADNLEPVWKEIHKILKQVKTQL